MIHFFIGFGMTDTVFHILAEIYGIDDDEEGMTEEGRGPLPSTPQSEREGRGTRFRRKGSRGLRGKVWSEERNVEGLGICCTITC